ncbi:MAG TPA: hypothetical protein VK644_06840 [Chitinophagaceae bacterium]|jgi:hypothetical protein|nr:hypothetical protein [Chitinophagaceae bacterium]
MKRYLPFFSLALMALLLGRDTTAQALAPDQNPNFTVSRDKYMQLADSLTRWESTTTQETYKAIDWLADRREARMDRREFRQQLRLERARWGTDYYDSYYNNYPVYRNPWNSYRPYNHGSYRRSSSLYLNPWGFGYRWH